MSKKQIKSLLFQIYVAGFNHGINDSIDNHIGVFDAFERLIVGQPPLDDGSSYAIKEKVENLLSLSEDVINK